MTDIEYRAGLDSIRSGLLALILGGPSDSEAATMAETIERAHAIGPFIDPTRYKARLDDGGLDAQQKLIRMYLRLRHDVRDFDPEFAKLMDAQEASSAAR